MNKFELTQKAKNLISENPSKSLELYTEAWEKFGNEFNEWDGFFLVRAMKDSNSYDRKLLRQIYKAFNQSQLVTSQMLWMYYEREIKDYGDKDLRNKEETVQKILNVGFQKDFTSTDNDFACPYTKIALKMADVFDERGLDNSSEKMLYWLEKINPDKLSKEPNKVSYNDNEKEYSSPFEKYYAKITKARYETDQFKICLDECLTALDIVKKFHNDSDLWIKRRLALCHYQLGNPDEAIKILEELLSYPATNKWFVKAEIADSYLAQENHEKALQFGIEAVLDEENYSFKIGLIKTLAETYDKLGKREVARYHVLLIKSILEKEEWNIKESHQELFDKHEIFDSETIEYPKILGICKDQWLEQQFAGQEKLTGRIKVIHGNGKSGHIEDENSKSYFFPIQAIQSSQPKEKQYEGSQVEFYLRGATDPKGNPTYHATNINVTSWNESEQQFDDLKEGAEYDGVVTNIKDFGIFINIKEYDIDGLAHKNTLKKDDKMNLLKVLTKGEKVKVKVTKITKKGPNLSILNY